MAVAVLAVVAHICVGPLHAHAGTVTTHGDAHGDRGDDGAAHGGSCDVLKSSPTLAAPVAAASIATVVDLLHDARRVVAGVASVPAPGTSPPLFLLHASLLI